MTQFIKGNYDLPAKKGGRKDKKPVEKAEPTLQEHFEQKALEKLGGSIAFVAKRSLVWHGEDNGESGDKAS